MKIKNEPQSWVTFCLLIVVLLTACQTSNAPAGTTNATTTNKRNAAPQRVDIKGSIIMRQYSQGQVVLEVEGFPSQDSRYNRAYVLVLPTTQIIGPEGKSISLRELQQGQNVAVLLRSGGKGNLVGMGIARKMWVE
ncbi:hypothetical protein [Adhaeribacter rhizoryzae]|uniref:DUF3221 domain-containing protein n=1 Tax=Adhaeribacter rhizoryzae TaxID=2607907 RepID=A0A5M6DPN8_9BACT|nr:hypothetical protein [Adhaeribacter rhizoryzae]KAA5547435.1 hypothetical protein F0145_08905 [Adhaeribacter rhizoryzae]